MKLKFTESINSGASKRNRIIALLVALLVLVAGYWVIMSKAAGFFASVNPEGATLSGNAKLVSESDGTKALLFTSPPPTTPPPTTPPPTTPPPSNGTQSCPAYPAFPNADCTGSPPHEQLLKQAGDVTLSTPGMVYEGHYVAGTIYVRANNITIKRTWAAKGIQIRGWEGIKGLVIEDSTIGPDPGLSGGDDGIAFSDYTCRRCEISGFSDGAKINGNVVIEDSLVHNLYIKPGDHADGLQNYDGSGNVTIRHSSILLDTRSNAAIFMADNPSGTMLIENNLLSGGQYTLQLLDNAGYTSTVRGNYFVRGSYTYGPVRLHQDPAKTAWEDNFLVDRPSNTFSAFTNKTPLSR